MNKVIIKEFLLNLFLFWLIMLYADRILVPNVPFSSQLVALALIAAYVVNTYLKAIETYGIKGIIMHHLVIGGAAVGLFTLGQFSYAELTELGFNFSEEGKIGYYQYLLLKTILNLVGVFILPRLIEFTRQKLRENK
ncbi:hypothetical protein E4T80_11900 [Muribacter muris]|uniref:Uncharacterized protein n=1 Tax=Muribacter muris TaxID=67855 RepID=A0A4Y9JQ39_9PAST|nr:hypothetical protein [Muribacter muris]MBF0786164.1 hypothetical protein [Muribacter muris]MBF0828305.1 hypothetical protein [Muribacter muris]TFV07688.1 hypothetical protein E4T80_11900 [Muribacter muris]